MQQIMEALMVKNESEILPRIEAMKALLKAIRTELVVETSAQIIPSIKEIFAYVDQQNRVISEITSSLDSLERE